MSVFRIINTVEELVAATQDIKARYLIIRNDLTDVPNIRLKPFQSIMGEFSGRTLSFQENTPGICLSKGNELRNLNIATSITEKAIYQDENIDKFATHTLSHLQVNGCISFIVNEKFEKGKIDASFIHVANADTTNHSVRPNHYDTDNLIGAMTVWNRSELDSTLEVAISHFSCGSQQQPIQASGLVLWGNKELKGKVSATTVSMGATYLSSNIPANAPDLVAGAFINGFQATASLVNIFGTIQTEGCNDMGIYNWGRIDNLSMTEQIVTSGANACAVINAGIATKLQFMHKIETKGTGAKGLFMYDGHIKELHLADVVTRGDAATAIQFSRHIDYLTIDGNVDVYGDALHIKLHDGTVVKASADAIGVKYGGTVRLLRCSGDITTYGNEVRTIYDEASIERMFVQGTVTAKGEESVALEINQGYFGAENIRFVSEKWAAVRVESAKVNNTHNLVAKGEPFDLLIDIMSSVDRNIFAKEFLGGVFQDDVVIEYIDNIDQSKEIAPEDIPTTTPEDEVDLNKN